MDTKCQSGFLHGPGDLNSHFFGCLKQSEREGFLNRLPANSRARVRNEELRITRLRSIAERRQDIEEGFLFRRHKQAIRRWRNWTGLKPRERSVENLPNGHSSEIEIKGDDELEDDLKPPKPVKPVVGFDVLDEALDVSVNVMFFKDSAPQTISEFLPEEFPDKKIPLNRLLYDEDSRRNPLLQKCPEDTVRYFHVPANDMKWVEELISCYYGDSDNLEIVSDDLMESQSTLKTKSEILLDQEVWRGQQRGPSLSDPVHTRSMRPRCDVIKNVGGTPSELSEKNRMPYLHWETYKARALQARTMKSCDLDRRSTTKKFSYVAHAIAQKENWTMESSRKQRMGRLRSSLNLLSSGYSSKQIDTSGSGEAPRNFLGGVLLQAAKLASAMDYYTDKTLLQNRLDLKPPLHPRRTLDQYYYWALKDVETQDKSQVVYRATAPKRHLTD
ncbi:hypothetical protein HYALB_00004426 [Hymenoscyphus albidus]|uniref:Uncharacterized protein n=1 Tax=Hymenoscyphus albidus TaxID=595503 RepID=A0A9N9LMC5_9HELO|nr:hypothetical protein HYALB_00004426 [Hymenoscyphus albidus]